MAGTTLVIFGAGASAGGFPPDAIKASLSWGPLPVTAGLFEARPAFAAPMEAYREIQPIILRLRTTARGLEQEMEALVSEAANLPQRKRQLLACRYYLRDIINNCAAESFRAAGGVTYYAALTDLLLTNVLGKGEKLVIVSFNYDVLVDRACLASGLLPLTDMDGYLGADTCLVKLHGSTNWARDVNFTDGNPPQTYHVQRGLVEHGERIVPTETRWIYSLDSFGPTVPANMIPAIAVPVVHKTDAQYECPPAQIAELRKRLEDVSRILIVGWKAQEPHFLAHLPQALRGREVRVLVANGSAEECAAAHDRVRRARVRIAGETEAFLNATRALDFGQLVTDANILPRWLSQ